MKKVESLLHSILAHDRLDGEWFIDDEGCLISRVSTFMLKYGATMVELEDSDPVKNKIIKNATITELEIQQEISKYENHATAGTIFTETRVKLEELGFITHVPSTTCGYIAFKKNHNIISVEHKGDFLLFNTGEMSTDSKYNWLKEDYKWNCKPTRSGSRHFYSFEVTNDNITSNDLVEITKKQNQLRNA